jgi:hypothetical protein
MLVLVHGCFYPLIVQWAILRALRYLLRRLPGDGACDLPKHVEDLLTLGVYILVRVELIYVVFISHEC